MNIDGILGLQVTGLQSIQSLYLNQDRVNEHFTTQIGAIESLVMSVEKKTGGGLNLRLIEVSKSKGTGEQVGVAMQDPLARVLILRAALQEQGRVFSPDVALPGQFVLATGLGSWRFPTLPPQFDVNLSDLKRAQIEALEEDRLRAEMIRHALGGPGSDWEKMWLVTLSNDDLLVAASPLNSKWIDDALSSYAMYPYVVNIFGVLRQEIQGVPTLASIHIWIDLA